MRWSCVVLLASVAAASAAVPPTHDQECASDLQCQYRLNPYCFCLRPAESPFGQCICNMDPSILNDEHIEDSRCTSHGDCHSVDQYKHCECVPTDYWHLEGKCQCTRPLG